MPLPDAYKAVLTIVCECLVVAYDEARAEHAKPTKDEEERGIRFGQWLAFGTAIQMIQEQAGVFEIPSSDLGLEGVAPP